MSVLSQCPRPPRAAVAQTRIIIGHKSTKCSTAQRGCVALCAARLSGQQPRRFWGVVARMERPFGRVIRDRPFKDQEPTPDYANEDVRSIRATRRYAPARPT